LVLLLLYGFSLRVCEIN